MAPPRPHLHHGLVLSTLKTSSPTEVLADLVERITFRNEETGFRVPRVKARGQRDRLVAVLGQAAMAMVSAGEFVRTSGEWQNGRAHGVQFRAPFLKVAAPTTLGGIEKYRGPGMIRGLGGVYARKLVGAFEEVFEIIEQELRLLAGADRDRPKAIVIPLTMQHDMRLQRKLVYTGVTRGKRLVIFVGQHRTLAIAVKGAPTRWRWSKQRKWLGGTCPVNPSLQPAGAAGR